MEPTTDSLISEVQYLRALLRKSLIELREHNNEYRYYTPPEFFKEVAAACRLEGWSAKELPGKPQGGYA